MIASLGEEASKTLCRKLSLKYATWCYLQKSNCPFILHGNRFQHISSRTSTQGLSAVPDPPSFLSLPSQHVPLSPGPRGTSQRMFAVGRLLIVRYRGGSVWSGIGSRYLWRVASRRRPAIATRVRPIRQWDGHFDPIICVRIRSSRWLFDQCDDWNL